MCDTQWSLKAISFHSDVKGRLITLSDGGRRVSRDESSFCHGLTFSGRPVKTQEKLRLRVERCGGVWHGALRLGFTNVSPEQTTLPPLAIPDLTNSPLYAAVLVPEHICRPGSEIEFMLKKNGRLRIRSSDGRTHTEQTTLNPKCPVWAMIDVYGQTTAVSMLGERFLSVIVCSEWIKGLSSPKNEISITIYSPSSCYEFLSCVEHKIRYFEECGRQQLAVPIDLQCMGIVSNNLRAIKCWQNFHFWRNFPFYTHARTHVYIKYIFVFLWYVFNIWFICYIK